MTQDITERIRIRFEHAAARKALQEKYEAKMIFAHGGGMWRAGPDLLTTLLSCPDTEAVILDIYNTPVKIQTRELYGIVQQRWQEQMTAWLIEWDQLQTQR